MESGKRKCVDEPLADKEGKVQWIETIKTPIYDDKGQVIGTTGIARDITERKRYEERLREAKAELEIRVKVRTAELSRTNEELRKEIAERRMLDEVLYQSEYKYRVLFESSPIGIALCDIKDARLRYANGAFCNMFGYTETEAVNLSFLDLHPAQISGLVKEKLDYVAGGKNLSEVLPCKRKDGKVIHARIVASHIAISGQNYNLAFFRDVTSEVENSRLIEAERDKLRQYMDIAQVITVAINADQTVALLNKKGADLLGYPEKEAIGKNWFDTFVPLREREMVRGAFFKLMRGEIAPVEYFENSVIDREGKERLIAWHNSLLTDNGIIIGTLSCGEDVTEKRRAEINLEESEKRYRGILESQRDLIVRVDLEGRFTFVNDAYCTVFGKTSDELLGKAFMPLVHKDDLPKTLEAMKRLEEPPYRVYVEQRAKTKHGWRWLAWEDCAIKDSFGKTIEIQAVGRDITDKKSAEERLDAKNLELEESNKKLKKLSLTDSHTGLFNHRYLQNAIEAEFHRAKRYASPLSVVMLDIDYFKSVNDVYGHQFGDMVLKQFAKELKSMLRRYDTVVRFGGEEFIIISPGTDKQQAFSLSRRMLEALNLHNFGNKEHRIKLKLSMGVVSYPEDIANTGMHMINQADKILNKAKDSGGNAVFQLEDFKNGDRPAALKDARSQNVKTLKNKIISLNKRANQSLTEAIFAFAKAIELKDHYTGEHVEITGHYAMMIAGKLNLPREEAELIRQASMLHDLGKIGISEKILLKRSKLTEEEFREIKKHPQIGADILRPIHFLHGLIPAVLYHHERWDGKGYPSGLKAEEIPVGARIIALADVYQALTSERPYRKAYSKAKAIQIIRENSGKQFDPKITGIFIDILREEGSRLKYKK
jgi:diguanylate cyclase (GGDEF)-like protein/PAS domain S-box-containing protein